MSHFVWIPKCRRKVFTEPYREMMKRIIHKVGFDYDTEIKRRYFWGGKFWTQSYFVETIGNATEDTIRKYVQNQLIELDRKERNSDQLGLF